MTVDEARKIVENFDENANPSGEDEFLFIECMNFLIEKEKNPADMIWLGGYYYEQRHFDLALKYYEMAATFDYDPAYECLGYIWYYGRTGTKDYKKAFEYFFKMMEKGNPVATYKVADMYKNGYYVEKDYEKYKELVEGLYPQVAKSRYLDAPLPEVFTRLARIRVEEGKKNEAVNLYLQAKDFLAQRIHFNPFFGNLSIMMWLIDDLYELIEFDEGFFDFFDIFYLLKTPHKIVFYVEDKMQYLESVREGNECTVCFNGKWFHDRSDFFKNAVVDGKALTSLQSDMAFFEVVEAWPVA